jgi:Xaa-Pro aminopeptidase
MMKMEADLPTWFGWIKDNLKEAEKVGLDFTQYPAFLLEERFKSIKEKGIALVSTPNLVDIVWGEKRPARPVNKIFHLETKYTGLSTVEKLKKIFEKLGASVDMMLVTSLDEIAWVLNMRGTDIAYNPVFFSYAILYPDYKIDLFIDSSKIEGATKEYI